MWQVIYQGWKQPRIFCTSVISGLRYLRIVLRWSRDAILVKFLQRICAHPAPMFPVITVGPFTKWGVYFMTCHPTSSRGHRYIIVVMDYFTKWAEAMPTFVNDGETATLFIFNQVITRFGVPREIVTDHGSHFQNRMMSELASKLGFRQEHSSPYYPQANGQVEAINKYLKMILRRMVNSTRMNWHLMLYLTLWAYQTSVKTATRFLTFSTHPWS
jgi:hypothetical protein